MIANRCETIHGIVLAGAHAWGGSALDDLCPRPLLPLVGRPVIWYVLDWLRRSGIQRVTICTNHNTRSLRGWLDDGEPWGLRLEYCEDPMPRGSAGCIRDAAERGGDSDLLVAVDGTVLTDLHLGDLVSAHRRSAAGLTLVAGKNVASAGSNGLEPAGIYIISREALDHIQPATYQDIKEMWIPRLYGRGMRVESHRVDSSTYVRVLNGATYLNATAWAVRKILAQARTDHDYRRVGNALVHTTARLAPSVRLVGSSVIGPDCILREGVTIVGPCVIGAGSTIERACVISHAAIWSHCEIGAGAVIDRSILAAGAVVEQGMVLRETVWGGYGRRAEPSADLYWSRPPAAAPSLKVSIPDLAKAILQDVPGPRLAKRSEVLRSPASA